MILTNSSEFIRQLVVDLEPIETALDNPRFSYTLGFNIKHNEIRQCKLYIRFFDRDDSFLKFFEIFTDANIKQMATHDFHHAEDVAFNTSALGWGADGGLAQAVLLAVPIFMVIGFLMIFFLEKCTNMSDLIGAFLSCLL